jgi:2-polyprenyl-3-methyl-5-hydroxy-6-metoxy-1,4-benzoquinol methylase
MKKHIKHNIEVTERIISNQKATSLAKMIRLRYNNIVNIIISHCNKELPLLDIGARKGELLDMFKNVGFKHLYAIEIWPEGIEILKEKNYKIINGEAEDFYENGKFGTIVMSHVLEHCPRPQLVVENAYNALRIKGLVYIEVPHQKKGDAPESAGHYSFFPDINSVSLLFDDKWVLIDSGKLRSKNIFVLMQKARNEK